MLPLLRFTLDLFDDAPVPVAAPKRAPRLKPASSELTLPNADSSAGLLTAPSELRFVHPRANRESSIAGVRVAYEFTRARRRSIGFVVGPDGLVVRAPRWTPLGEIEAALQEKGRWILRKLQESREHRQRQQHARVDWRAGAVFPFLAEPVEVQLDPTHAFGRKTADLLPPIAAGGPQRLCLSLPSHAEPTQIRDAVQAWLMQQAHALFRQRLDHYAPQVGVQWSRLRLSSAATRWGSASADGSIRLNWRLVHFSLPVIDYVVVHELSHLRVMDHSPRFWDTVAAVIPDYAQRRQHLKDDTAPRW